MANKSNKWLYIGIGAIVLVGLLGIAKSMTTKKGEKVYTTKVEKRTIQETVLASGKIFPRTEVKISSDVSGEVIDLYVKEGDTVHVGQVLAKINQDAYVSAVERGRASVNSAKAQEANARAQAEGARARKIQAEAQLEQVQVQMKNAKSILDRNKQLFKKGVISQADFDAAETAFSSASANYKSAQAAVASAEASFNSAQESIRAAGFSINNAQAGLKELNTSLNRTTIKAPMDGILSKLSVEKGERVVGTIQMAGTEMMRISDFSVMEAQVEVSETNVLQLSVGDKANIEIDAYPDRKFKGTISEIGSSASNLNVISINSDQVTNFKVKIVVELDSYRKFIKPGKPFPLRPGMSASVDIFTKKAEGVPAVLLSAVSPRDREGAKGEIDLVVFEISGDTVSQKVVTTGIQDDEYIEIKSGLEVGAEVVKGPSKTVSLKLKNGSKVAIKDEKEDKDHKK